MIQLTDNGIEIQTYQEVFDELANGYKAIYGNDINLDQDTPDGQRIAIEARQILDMQVYLSSLYNSLDPDFATGLSLERLLKLSGITRRPATKSQVDVTINVSRNLTLPVGYKVQDELGQLWETDGEKTLFIGDNTVTLFAEEFGATEAQAGTVNEQATIVLGVVSITNDTSATVGQDEETDVELRVKRNKSLQNPSSTGVGSMFSAIAQLPNVTDLAVYENFTNQFDTDTQMEAHSIWVVVEGGTVEGITETIIKNKDTGTGLKGDVTGEYTETVTVGDLTFDRTTTVEFDRPISSDIFLKVNIKGEGGIIPNTDLIKQQLSNATYSIGDDVVASKLYNIIYTTQDGIVATDLEISSNGIDYVDTLVDGVPATKYVLDVDNIDINLI